MSLKPVLSRSRVIRAGAAAASICALSVAPARAGAQAGSLSVPAPSPDRRVGLKPGQLLSPEVLGRASEKFLNQINSDLTFTGSYPIQGSFAGYQVWDISNPNKPTLKTAYFCPASQSDVSVYKNLLFVSAEAETARLDCGAQGVATAVSTERVRGIRSG